MMCCSHKHLSYLVTSGVFYTQVKNKEPLTSSTVMSSKNSVLQFDIVASKNNICRIILLRLVTANNNNVRKN